jgi:SAM-dependent methyltransferase
MRAPLEAALEAVALRLHAAGIPFLLGGGALLDALGLDAQPRDVDLMLRPEDRAAFEAACSGWLRGVTTEPGEVLSSDWKATLDVDGVEVDGLGGLGFTDGPRVPFRAAGSRRYGAADVPLCDPAIWWALYRAYKPAKAALLEPLVPTAARARILVELGYTAVAERYRRAVEATDFDPRLRFLAGLAERLPDGAEVLDLGCGAGRPNAALLAERFRVTGVDVSERQLELARAAVPGATFLHADIAEVELPEGAFDATVALYSIAHLPRERHGPLYDRIAGWLRPGGLFLASLACSDEPGTIQEDWLGAPMYFSSFDAATNRRLIEAAGFAVLHDEVVTMCEGGSADSTFQWVLGRLGSARGCS